MGRLDELEEMRTSLLVKVLHARRQLRRREFWSPARVAAHQERALRGLREYASTASPFYRALHRGLGAAPLAELPVMTK